MRGMGGRGARGRGLGGRGEVGLMDACWVLLRKVQAGREGGDDGEESSATDLYFSFATLTIVPCSLPQLQKKHVTGRGKGLQSIN